MTIDVLGISGSPIKNSNTDRVIQAMLETTQLESEFIKLSWIKVRPCLACKGCVSDNNCVQKDDFPELAEKIKKARALIIGAYTPYGQIDGFTKALLERLWSMRHQKNLLEDKLLATVVTSLRIERSENVNEYLAKVLAEKENMDLLGQVSIVGNLPCLHCDLGDTCKMSGVQDRYGPDAKTCDYPYSRVEDQEDVWENALRIGKLIGERSRMELTIL
jgi:multimeric flavodoxin WrbA